MCGGAMRRRRVCPIEQRWAARDRYAWRVTSTSDAAVERIRRLEEQLARAPANSAQHRQLAKSIQIEAIHYRKSLDAEQAAEQFDPKP